MIPRRLRTLSLTLALAACISPAPGISPTANSPGAAITSSIPSVEPTGTPSSPASRTAEPTSTLTPLPPASATPSPLPAGQIGPHDFPPDVNPLTGLAVADPAKLNRRPLAIKVSNSPACVRPQAGLSLADLVFEHYAEGPTTRFTAVFYSHDAPKVGSVRSARLIDLEIPAMYQTLLAFSGASPGMLTRLKEIDFKDRILSPEFEPGHKAFFRVPKESLTGECQVLEHTLFTSTDRLWADAEAKGVNQRPVIIGTVFNAAPPPASLGGQPAGTLSLAYDGVYVRWNYSPTAGLYYRYANGQQHKDTLTNSQITAANVVVVFVHHVLTDFLENLIGYDPKTGRGGSHSIQIQLWGTGPAQLYRDGQMYPVTWVRQGRGDVLELVDAGGQPVALKPGVTWFQLAPLDSPVKQVEANAWEVKPTRLVDKP